jgi:putative peptidoglycan lipid II flippase
MSEELRVARHAGAVGAATLLSRLLGLVREQVMAVLFGAGFATDAFNVAFRIPNLLRDLFAEGAMSSAFVPTFTEVQSTRGDAEAWKLGLRLIVALSAILLVVCALGYAVAPWLVRIFAPGFGSIPGKLELTVLLTRVMLPFLPLVAVAAAVMGMLNARGRFAVPGLAPAMLNVGMVVGGVALIPVLRRYGEPAILAMALGVVLGGAGQLAFQLPALWAEGFRLRFQRPLWDPGVARVARLMLPATVGLAATQLNLFVSTLIASLLEQGSVSWLWYAFRLMQLPIGVFGVALATVSLPTLSRAAVGRDLGSLKTTLSATLRLVFLLTAPAAVWLAVMARPVVALLYEHGRFGPTDTIRTGDALVMYCLGLPAFAAVGVLTRTFYALGDTGTPLKASFVAVALNLALNLLFVGPLRFLGLGHLGLALATSATSIANLLQLGFYLRRRIGPMEARRMIDTLARVLLAAGIGVLPSFFGLRLVGDSWHGRIVAELAVVSAGLGIAVVAGYLAMKRLRVAELDTVEALVRAGTRRILGR